MTSLSASVVLTLVALGSASAQTPDGTIQALLAEVRQLRLAVERATAAAPRIQITLQRLQLQEQKVATLTQRHSVARDNVARLSSLHSRFADHLRSIEGRIAAEQDTNRKQALEQERRSMAAQVDDHRQQAQQAQLLESELSSALRAENARVDELVQRLTALERSLELK
jgi:hypothetical protein